jgi:heparosan-N-sulfate-glucuronate 5-epimerase
MKEEYRKIKLKIGEINLNDELGIYYIDLRSSIVNYTKNIYNGGIDDLGVPFLRGEKGDKYYTAVNIAQYGLILHAEYLEKPTDIIYSEMMNCANKIVNISSSFNSDCIVWYYYSESSKYKMKNPWTSAMAQGQVISFLLRIYQITKKNLYFDLSIKAYNYLQLDISKGGVKRIDENGFYWLEEYPSDPPSYVLNGFIYALFGLFDLFRVTKNLVVKNEIDSYVYTLRENIHKFDSGYWSYYDLLHFELVRYYYQLNVHSLQLEVLHHLTNESVFMHYAEKWKKNVNPINFLFVRMMYRIQPRWRRKTFFLNR